MNDRQRAQTAVALRYHPQSMTAPSVTAIGNAAAAAEIVRIARQRAIPIEMRENLTYRLARLGEAQTIPPELYEEVAAILAEYQEFS